MKVNISLDDSLVGRIDSYADNNYMSRSGLISLACTNYLNSADVITAVKTLTLAMQKIAATGDIDETTKQELEDFSRLANLIVGTK